MNELRLKCSIFFFPESYCTVYFLLSFMLSKLLISIGFPVRLKWNFQAIFDEAKKRSLFCTVRIPCSLWLLAISACLVTVLVHDTAFSDWPKSMYEPRMCTVYNIPRFPLFHYIIITFRRKGGKWESIALGERKKSKGEEGLLPTVPSVASHLPPPIISSRKKGVVGNTSM